MNKHLPTAVAAALILMAGTVHGIWTNRWGDNPDLRYAVEHLGNIPLVIGDWEGEEITPDEAQATQIKKAELRIAIQRNYTNRQTGEQIQLMAVCGPSGPVALHTPETCYGATGVQAGAPVLQDYPLGESAGAPPAQFLMADFRSADSAVPRGVKVYWSWRKEKPDDSWVAPENARTAFAAVPALYKIYVVRSMQMPVASPVPDDVTPDFIRQLMPAVEQTVFGPMKNTPTS